ncbi:DsbA family oxidoreductase [Cognaticolwellia beringensis]|uniref:DsbA family oxidoreductase n=1 Tax=Cognaticolwellia beringensis TaxID=1967665 RepID=A0A222G896_9GAMM|nr:DsbA family oxidoreductase [Cognaticolwellia beringensis]ASP48125.1 DsbA family oxidoreductase [Cognaticolwellia beringensis]
MTKTIKIDIISDVVCPWCVIGFGNLNKAIIELGLENKVEIEWQPFELNPDMPLEGEELSAHSARKYGSTPESSAQFRAEMTAQGKTVNFDFNYFEGMKIINTRDAHILLEYAKTQGKQTALQMRLFSAFFTEKKDVSNREILALEVEAVGLNVKEAMAKLQDNQVIQHVIEQESYWQKVGVSSVPTVVFNGKSALAGAQPIETFKQVLADELESL